MIKRFYIAVLLFWFFPLYSQNQEASEKRYEEKGKGYTYVRDRNYKGPDEWFGSSPSQMKQKEPLELEEEDTRSSGISQDRVTRSREKMQKNGKGSTLPEDPATQKAEPIELPDFDAPDIDTPDLPDVDAPALPQNFWRILLIILLITVVVLLVFWYLKNHQASDKKIEPEFRDHDWNPEEITKSELDTRLDEALVSENYRECVRIYFTFILKELISQKMINWKKEKTNYDYLLEMSSKPNVHMFRECVRIYDLVWYGEYVISGTEYDQIVPVLNTYYQHLQRKK